MRTVTIADAHSENKPKQKITLEMSGGSPWYAYVWVCDVCYAITKADGGRSFKIKKATFPDC